MYRLAKDWINTGLFKVENTYNMEWIYEFFGKNYLKNVHNPNILFK